MFLWSFAASIPINKHCHVVWKASITIFFCKGWRMRCCAWNDTCPSVDLRSEYICPSIPGYSIVKFCNNTMLTGGIPTWRQLTNKSLDEARNRNDIQVWSSEDIVLQLPWCHFGNLKTFILIEQTDGPVRASLNFITEGTLLFYCPKQGASRGSRRQYSELLTMESLNTITLDRLLHFFQAKFWFVV